MGDLIFRRDRDSLSRDKTKRQALTHTDGQQGPQKDERISPGRRKK